MPYMDWGRDASDEEDEASEQESSDEDDDASQQDNYDEVDQTGLMEGVGQRQCLFTKLLRALWPPSARKKSTSLGTFAVCEGVRYAEGFILPSFHVEGVGELQLPLSTEGATKLRSACEVAPFGIQGSATRVAVGRCWQMAASEVSFPAAPAFLSTTVQAMAVKAVKELGLDGEGAQQEAKLYKLLIYEAGGHYLFRRDTEKEKGMFASLILQLPTDEGYKGGKLVVQHGTKQKEFDCHMVSALGFCYTVFFADCHHEVQEIKSGTKLCLVFDLVKRDCSLDARHRENISSRVGRVEDALRPWLKEATSRTLAAFGPKLAIPLRFKYAKEDLSFAGLKGEDNIVVELLKDCKDENNERWLDLHLVLATKQVMVGENVFEEETLTYQKWTAVGDTPVRKPLEKLGVDIENEVVLDVGRHPFHHKTDEKYWVSRGRSELWYYKAMLVVWPKTLSVSVACQAGVSGALDLLESTGHSSLKDGLHQIISYCETDASVEANWFAERTGSQDSKVDPITPRLLDLCITAKMPAYVVRVLQLLAKTISYKPRYERTEKSFKVGVRNMEVASCVVSAVQAFGWRLLSSHIINMANDCALAQGESFALLAKQLITTGNADAGRMVAEATFRVFETLIAELDSQKMPEFSWHQPDAKIPGYPELVRFLRGPEETYVYRGEKDLPAMRTFVSEHLNCVNYTTATWGFSATGTPEGKGQGVFCVIQKTRDVYDKSVAHWRQEQQRLNRLRLELENLRSVVPPTNLTNVTTFGESSERKRENEDVGPR